MKLPALCIALVLTALPACAQTPDPAMFEPGLISNDGVFGLTMSPDGRHALWVASGGKREVLTIMESRKVAGKWQTPTVAPFSGKPGWKDIDPAFSPDGKTLIFQSNRPVADKPERKGFDIYAVEWNGTGWGAARHLGNALNTDVSESSATLAANGNLYFMKALDAAGQQSDLWVSSKADGLYQAAHKLAAPVNTDGARESNPFIAPDESYLIYFSAVGNAEPDLVISFRDARGNWSTPVPLGAPYNTAAAEFCPFVQGGRLYLSRQVKQSERMIENIYSYPFDPAKYAPRK